MSDETRLNEWFVPKFGPLRFRIFVGLLFLPYTGMCISFVVIGSMLAPSILWDRVAAISVIYALALGVSAHVADSMGSKKAKPWGEYFGRRQLLVIMISSLVAAYAIGIYYMILYVPLLWAIAILEGFFLFAYNFEMFNGRFHTDFWFAVSWGFLPVMAGYIMQTNSIDVIPIAVSAAAGLASYAEIKMSRPYKELKKRGDQQKAKGLENNLKYLSVGTMAVAGAILIYRIISS